MLDGLGALLMGGLAGVQRDLIYHPGLGEDDPAKAGVPDMLRVRFQTEDGLTLTSWYAAPAQEDRATLVLFHGNAGSLSHRAGKARQILDAGFGLLMLGYRGFSGNPGRPSEAGLYADARAALAWLRDGGTQSGQTVLYGESLGTGVAVQMAVERDCAAALVLEAAYTSLPALVPDYLVPGLASLLMVDRFDTLSKIGRVRQPTLLVHGGMDGLVPPGMARALAKAARDGVVETAFMPSAGHTDIWDLGGGRAILDFVGTHVG